MYDEEDGVFNEFYPVDEQEDFMFNSQTELADDLKLTERYEAEKYKNYVGNMVEYRRRSFVTLQMCTFENFVEQDAFNQVFNATCRVLDALGCPKVVVPQIRTPAFPSSTVTNDVYFPFTTEDWVKIIKCDGKLNVFCASADLKACKRICTWIPYVLRNVIDVIYSTFADNDDVKKMSWWQCISELVARNIKWGEKVSGIDIYTLTPSGQSDFLRDEFTDMLVRQKNPQRTPITNLYPLRGADPSIDSKHLSPVVGKCRRHIYEE